MIDSIIKFAVSQRLIVLMAVIGLTAAGLFSFQRLPIDAVPDVTNVQVQILTVAPSLAPLEVERLITFPVEVGISGVPGIRGVRSISKFGLSAVTVVFNEDVDIYFARQLIQQRLAQIKDQIPPDINTPEMGPISTGLGEIYQYELTAKPGFKLDQTELRTVQDWFVRRQLMGIPGVAEVNSFGGQEKQYQIRLDQQKLHAYKLAVRDVFQAVAENNANVGGAYIEQAGEQYVLRGIALAANTEELGNIIVKTGAEGVPIYVKDVAEVMTGAAVRQGAVTADSKGEVTAGIVMMLKGENTRTLVERVHERVEQLSKSLPPGVNLDVFYNRAELIDRTIETVKHNLLEGALLVILVLILLLGNWRGALLVASVIPLSMLFAAVCMDVFKVSGNLMSLGAIDFGLIVDGAVVMVENSIRRVAEADQERLNKSHEDVILESCLEVGRPVVFAVFIIAIVYLPILSLTGIEGKMFKPMAMTVVFALLGSLLLALTYIPAAMTYLLKGKVSEQESLLIRAAKRFYEPTLRLAIKNGKVIVAIGVALLAIALAMFPFLGAEFIPRLDEGALAVQVQQLPSVSLPQSIHTATSIEKTLITFPEVTKVLCKIGRAQVATDPMGPESLDVYVALKPPSEWKSASTREGLIEKMSDALKDRVPSANFSFSQPIEMRTAELIAGVRSDIAIKIFGEDLDTLRSLAEKISRVVAKVSGAEDVKVEQTAGLPQLVIKVNRAGIARYGINAKEINNIVESIAMGMPAGFVYEGEKRFELVVRLKPDSGNNIEKIRNLLVAAPNGAQLPLRELANVSLVDGPAQISREERQRRTVVELNVRGRDIASFVKDAQVAISRDVTLPPGYVISWGGQFQNLKEASDRLAVVVPLAMFLIFVLLLTTFGSIKDALLIYSGIPFAVVGGVFSLALRGMPFSISAGVGFIALFGVAVLNGVVLLSYINALRDEKSALVVGDEKSLLYECVTEGALTRLRPVLMTALVASLGFIPMAISTSSGAEVQRPLATVVIGGLITSTILTLYILPILYLWFEHLRAKPSDGGDTSRMHRPSDELTHPSV